MPARTRRRLKGPVAGPASMIRVGRSPHYLNHWPGGAANLMASLGFTLWYDARDLTATNQTTLTNRLGAGTATLTNGLIPLPGSGYVYLPGTASNNLSVPKDGGWAGTLHVTATLVDNTTATFTTTASPILIGGTDLAAGRYKRFDVRDTDANGTTRVTINLATETIGHTSWTATTGQTVTVNRSSTGYMATVCNRPGLLADGTNDFLQLPAGATPTFTAAAGVYTVVVAYNTNAKSQTSVLYSSEASNDAGATLFLTASGVQARIGNNATTTTAAGGAGTVAAGAKIGAFVKSAGGVLGYGANGATSSVVTSVDPSHTSPRSGSRAHAVSLPYTGVILTVAAGPVALTTTQLGTVSTYLTGSYS